MTITQETFNMETTMQDFQSVLLSQKHEVFCFFLSLCKELIISRDSLYSNTVKIMSQLKVLECSNSPSKECTLKPQQFSCILSLINEKLQTIPISAIPVIENSASVSYRPTYLRCIISRRERIYIIFE